MEYKALLCQEPACTASDEWRVEAIDHDSEGECYVTIFYGLHAEDRAREYAAWKNGNVGNLWPSIVKLKADARQLLDTLAQLR